MAEKHWELNSFLMKVKGESEKSGLKLKIKNKHKNKIMELGSIILRYFNGIQLN